MKWLKNSLLVIILFECLTIIYAPKLCALEVAPYTPSPVLDDSPLIITGYSTSTSLDYVQIYNPTDIPINLNGWRLEVVAKDGAKKELAKLADWIAPSNYLIASNGVAVTGADFIFDATGMMVGSTIRLASDTYLPHDIMVDKVGMYQRKKSTKTYEYLTTFESTTNPSLYGGGFYTYESKTPLQVYEVLAHPRMCSPLDVSLDCNDYVKLYNPSDTPIDLSTVRLRIGYNGQESTASNTYILSGQILPGHYIVIDQDETGRPISVTNGGGYVWLEDAYGIVRYDTTVQNYDDASSETRQGQAWTYDTVDNTWKWTATPTPVDGPNILTTDSAPAVATLAKVYAACEPGEYRSEDTHRCRSSVSLANATLALCDADEFRNTATGRCNKIVASDDKSCPVGQERNPTTGRCRLIQTAITEPAFAVEPMEKASGQFMGWWTIGGVGTLAAGYGIWEWRKELWAAIRKVGAIFTSKV